MAHFLSVIFVLALIMFLVGLVLATIRSTRGIGQTIGAIGFWGAILTIYPLISAEDREATDAGFASASDYKEATKMGIKDPSVWEKRKADMAEQRRNEEAAAENARRKLIEEKERIEAERKAAEEARCRADIQCWGEKFMMKARIVCPPYIERLAKNNFEWFDGTFDAKFTHLKWRKKSSGVVISYAGDKIKFQNGFGAWIIHTSVERRSRL